MLELRRAIYYDTEAKAELDRLELYDNQNRLSPPIDEFRRKKRVKYRYNYSGHRVIINSNQDASS